MASALPIKSQPLPSPPSTQRTSNLLKKALTIGVGATFAATMAIGLYGTHSDTFQHDNARLLAELANATGIHVTFTPRTNSSSAPTGMAIEGYLFPKTSADDGTLSFDGRISYVHINSQYNFTLLDDRGYVTVQDLTTGTITRNSCLTADNIPPISTFTEVLLDARVIDDVSAFNVDCNDGKLVELIFADEPYVFCSSSTGSLDSVQGEDLTAAVELLTENSEDIPSIDSLSPSGLDLTTCELLTSSSSSSSSSSTRRLMKNAIQRTKDAVQVLSGQPRRSLADMSSCSCSGGKKECLFVHGFGYDDGDLTTSFDYFGTIDEDATCCSSVNFIHLDTVNEPWYSDTLTDKLCATALEVSGGSDASSIENVAIVAHSMGNLITASALMKGTCAFASSSKWIALNGPVYGSATATFVVSIWDSLSTETQEAICTPDGTTIDDAIYSVLADQGLCPSDVSLTSIALANSSVSTDELNALYLKAGATFASKVTSSMCGVNYVGLLSTDSIEMTLLGVISGHASSANDGEVEISSCRATLSDSKYSTSYSGGNFYKASINHLDGAFRNGDGWWGADRKPVKWFNCQF